MQTNNAHGPEIAVLATALLDSEAMAILAEGLNPSDFGSTRHRVYFEVMMETLKAYGACDAALFTDRLRAKGLVGASGASDALAELLDGLESLKGAAVPLGQLPGYIGVIKGHAVRRQLTLAGQKIQALGQSEDVTAALADAQSLVAQISLDTEAETPDLAVSSARAFQQLRESIEHPDRIQGLATGYTDLDNITRGLKAGELIVLAGRPGMGKSTLALNIVLHTLKAGEAVVVFSMEMTTEQVLAKLLTIEAGSCSDLGLLAQARDRVNATPLVIYDTNPMTVARMQAKTRQAQFKHGGVGLIVVDHLQLVSGEEKTWNSTERMTQVSGGLKGLAMSFKCPVLGLSQLNRGVESRTDKRPMMSDLRESGAIEQDAGLVAMLYRDDYYNRDSDKPGVLEVNVSKNRYGKTGTVELSFRPDISTFKPYTHYASPFGVIKGGKK